MKTLTRLVFILIAAVAAGGARGADPDFGSYWHDGNAELSGYRMVISRYGEKRTGRGVAIYVTEPFSESKRVKVDDPSKNPGDVVDALKLNLVRDFQTGIYDYNTMVSVFVRSADFSPLKVTLSSAEWCGHVYEELLFFPQKVSGNYYSYFEGESGPRNLAYPKNGIVGEQLLILLRGLRGDFLKPGETRTFPFLPSLYVGRLSHKPLEWTTAEITRAEATETIEVPAGKFETIVYHTKVATGLERTFYVEAAYPHRIIRWEAPPDLSADLTGTARLKYWQLHNNGDERYLKELGITPP